MAQAADKRDPDFTVSKEEGRAADAAAAEEPGTGALACVVAAACRCC